MIYNTVVLQSHATTPRGGPRLRRDGVNLKRGPDEFRLGYYLRWNNFRICHRGRAHPRVLIIYGDDDDVHVYTAVTVTPNKRRREKRDDESFARSLGLGGKLLFDDMTRASVIMSYAVPRVYAAPGSAYYDGRPDGGSFRRVFLARRDPLARAVTRLRGGGGV